MKRNKKLNSPYPIERKHRRFDLEFPVLLSFPSSGNVRELAAMSKNVSTGGFLLKTVDAIPPTTHVGVTMEVQGPWSRRTVRLQGEGEVVRVEKLADEPGFAIAIKCEKPISQMENSVAS